VKGRILAVDDDPAILDVLRLNLEAEGYEVATAGDAATAERVLALAPCVLAILDVMLPDADGFELARSVRDRSDIPIIMLSARDSDVDKAVGLGVGADDYVTKPFSPVELVARVKAHLRRYAAASSTGRSSTVIGGNGLRLDCDTREVLVDGRPVDLTATEFDVLRFLAEHPGRVHTKAQIFWAVWGEEPIGDLNTVQVHIRRLRTKIERDASSPKLIGTVWGIGYRFERQPS
jgi:DNA-binding response OmpR family regulator